MAQTKPLTTLEKHACLTTCMMLRFQCIFLDEGLPEMLTLLRLNYSFGRAASTQRVTVPLSTQRIDKHDFLEPQPTCSTNPTLITLATQSSTSLGKLVYGDKEHRSLALSMALCLSCLANDMPEALKRFYVVFLTLLQMPEASFRTLMDPAREVSCILMAHYVALTVILTAQISSSMKHRGTCIDW